MSYLLLSSNKSNSSVILFVIYLKYKINLIYLKSHDHKQRRQILTALPRLNSSNSFLSFKNCHHLTSLHCTGKVVSISLTQENKLQVGKQKRKGGGGGCWKPVNRSRSSDHRDEHKSYYLQCCSLIPHCHLEGELNQDPKFHIYLCASPITRARPSPPAVPLSRSARHSRSLPRPHAQLSHSVTDKTKFQGTDTRVPPACQLCSCARCWIRTARLGKG